MKTTIKILFVAAALVAAAFASDHRKSADTHAAPPPPPTPPAVVTAAACPQCASMAAAPARRVERRDCDRGPVETVRVIYVAEPIRWAPAYYGPHAYDNASRFSDPFTAIRVNPIPYPDYSRPVLQLVGRDGHGARQNRRH